MMLSEAEIHARRVDGMDFPRVFFEYQDYLRRSRHGRALGILRAHGLGAAALVAADKGVRPLHNGPGGAVVGLMLDFAFDDGNRDLFLRFYYKLDLKLKKAVVTGLLSPALSAPADAAGTPPPRASDWPGTAVRPADRRLRAAPSDSRRSPCTAPAAACRQRESFFFTSPLVRDITDMLDFAFDDGNRDLPWLRRIKASARSTMARVER